ncbi:hypothetical protein C0Q70_04060 [Pomacea canaliculata]|uniref:Uncharacterized protein n=1 Tax=Pomacea canaliculata TaxID=400727 RepID=A0A2T7PUK8_POMCA|nr:hypothetical protein C0Q70_04060 [Pomacea canaliculata]
MSSPLCSRVVTVHPSIRRSANPPPTPHMVFTHHVLRTLRGRLNIVLGNMITRRAEVADVLPRSPRSQAPSLSLALETQMNGGDFKDKIPIINSSVLKAMKTRRRAVSGCEGNIPGCSH